MRIIATHDTELKELNSFIVLPSKNIVLCGRVGRNPYAYHIYSQSYNKLELKSTSKVACKHEVHMLPFGSEDEFLATCEWCKKINLVDLRKDKTTTVFSGEDLWPGRLCDGARDQIFVYSLGKVLELGVAKPKLLGPNKTIDTGLSNCLSVVYICPQRCVVLSDGSGGVVRAVSCDTKKNDIRWEVKGIVDGKMCDPQGLVYLTQQDVLLVSDGSNTRVLVLDPRDGKHRQTIDLPEEMGEIDNMFLVQDDIVMGHMLDCTFKLSFLSLR